MENIYIAQDEGVMELAENSPALRYLCVSNCVNLTDQVSNTSSVDL